METTIKQQVALDETLVPSTKRLRIRRNVLEICMQEFWATATVHHHSIRFKMNNKKHIINLETFRDMLHVCPRVPGQSFDELPFEAKILEFLRFLGHSDEIRTLTDIEHKKQKKALRCIIQDSRRDDNIFSTIKVVSRHQNTQQYGAILPIELTNEDISNTTAYKEYYACATGVAAPKPKASARKKRGYSDTSITPPIATPTPITTAAPVPRITAATKGKQPAKAKKEADRRHILLSMVVPVQMKELVLNQGFQMYHLMNQKKKFDGTLPMMKMLMLKMKAIRMMKVMMEVMMEMMMIMMRLSGSEDEGNDEEDQDLRLSEEARIQEEEEADELYRDVDINQGKGLQVSKNIEDSHVTLTSVHPDGLQESSSVWSFVTSMLNPISDAGVESIFTMASSPIVSLQTPTPIMTPSTIATITTSSDAPIPPTTIPNKTILDTYRELTILKRRREDDDQEGPSAGLDRGSKRQREGGEHASASTPSETATGSAGRSTTGSQSRQLFASAEDQPIVQTSQHPEWFSQPRRPPTPDRDWNKTLPTAQGNAQSWISELARQTDVCSSFNELLDTPIDFSNFIMNQLSVDTLTLKLLAGPTFELMRGSFNSLTELEYHLEEVYTATTDQLDWVNPEGQQYPHNLLQPLLLIHDNRGRRVIPFEHFINNDLEYLQGGASSRKYTTSVTKKKAADYGYIKWIEDLVPRAMWIQELINYDRRIIAVTELKIMEWHNYKHLDWILVRRDDDKIYKFKEGDLKRLRLQDIQDMLLLLVQGKLSNLTVEERFAFNVSLRMFTRSIVIQMRVEDL
nr:hypothetical protein [Tanacetum cinerariifolium]